MSRFEILALIFLSAAMAVACSKDDPDREEATYEGAGLLGEASAEETILRFNYDCTIENEITHVALSKPDKLKGTVNMELTVKIRPMHGFSSSVNDATDYYLVSSTLTVESDKMYSGNFVKKHGGVKARICGYYLRGLKTDISLTDGQDEVGYLVQVPTPETVIGQTKYTTSWGFSVGGGITAGTLPGATSKLGVSVSSKTDYTLSDCDIASRHEGNVVGYDYIINNLPSYNSKLKINPPPLCSVSTASFNSQWIWAVPTKDRDSKTVYKLKARIFDICYGASYFYSSKADYHDLKFNLSDKEFSGDAPMPNRWPTGELELANTVQDSYISSIKLSSEHYTYDDGSSKHSYGNSFSTFLPVGEYTLACKIKGADGKESLYQYSNLVKVREGEKVNLVSGQGFVTTTSGK